MPIYTRTGDKGKTSLFNGRRVSKDSLRIEAIGSVDELNAIIGTTIAKSQISNLKSQNYHRKAGSRLENDQRDNSKLKIELEQIQNDLFEIGAMLANPKQKTSVNLEKRAKEFEILIDETTKKLPRLFNFILPGGGEAGATLHLARTVSRRTERRVVELSKKEKINSSVLIYINRLSDLLFTMARFVNFKEEKKETIWRSK